MSGIQQLLLGGSPAGYQIERSLRFNSADSAYLNRTFGTPTGTTKGTWSGWVKRGTLGTQQVIFSSSNFEFFEFQSTDKIRISNIDGNAYWVTTQVFRDPSAWYHLVIAWDSTLATATDRCKFWVNGVRVTQWDSQPTITQNTTFARWNVSGYSGSIGRFDFNGTLFLSAYQTEIYWVDGQALTPSSFGQSDPNTGVWSPIKYTGTYGTNGFYLNFSDNSNTTAATLGKDSSGNGNNWTPNNFSVTAGAGNDSLVDTPTSYGVDTGVGGEVRGNYATQNPNNKHANQTLTNGNLDQVSSVGGWNTARNTFPISSGKWYWEVTMTGSTRLVMHGVDDNAYNIIGNPSSAYVGAYNNSWSVYASDGARRNNTTSGTSYGSSFAQNDVMMVALDMDNGRIWWGKNGTWFNSGNPASGTNAAYTNLSGYTVTPATSCFDTTDSCSHNFGQRAFAYAAPSGYKALCTQNLPTPTIGATSTTQAGKYFNTVLYSGNSSTQNITGVGFAPDAVWLKVRNDAQSHRMFDTVRGASQRLIPNATSAEANTPTELNAFGTDGFTLGSNTDVNGTGFNYVSWNWNAGGSNATNTSGTITSTVRANTTAGFSIVTYTGTGSNATVGHGLGVAPRMFITKNRDSGTPGWAVYHASVGNTGALALNATTAVDTNSVYFNNTTPTSTVFSVGTGTAVNTNTQKYVAYCFAEVAGYSAFGSYTGNGSTDGPFVFTGFRPRFVLLKRTDTTGNWTMYDTARNPYNPGTYPLYPNLSNAEDPSTDHFDWLSNGFKMKSTNQNTNGGTYIFAAFCESPFKFSLAR